MGKIIEIDNELGHQGQDPISKGIGRDCYGVSRDENLFLIKLCEICRRRAESKSKDPLIPFVSSKIFERGQIDLIDKKYTPNGQFVGVYYLVDHFSKIRDGE